MVSIHDINSNILFHRGSHKKSYLVMPDINSKSLYSGILLQFTWWLLSEIVVVSLAWQSGFTQFAIALHSGGLGVQYIGLILFLIDKNQKRGQYIGIAEVYDSRVM